jgi:hypothetical protein
MKNNIYRLGPVVPGAAFVVGALLYGLCANTASADDEYYGPLVTLDYGWSGGQGHNFVLHKDSDKHWHDPAQGAWIFVGGAIGAGGNAWVLEWDVAASANGAGGASSSSSEFVNANLSITNLTAQPQTFTALVTLALPKQFVGGTLMNGNVAATVTDNDGNGAFLTNSNNESVYQAFIDGDPWNDSPVHTLFDPGFSLTAAPFGSDSDSDSFGVPNPIPGPEALNTISVYLIIELSAFDTASVVGTFQIAQLPAPGALPLLAGMAFAFGRRRRS